MPMHPGGRRIVRGRSIHPPPGEAAGAAAAVEMRIALYTPSDHPGPSPLQGGPGLMRLLAQALDIAGHQAIAPSDFRSDEGHRDSRRQAALERRGAARAARLVAAYRDLPASARPEAWLTCHLRHWAPDLIGPAVAGTLGIPYLLVGASYVRAEAGSAPGRWPSYAARAIAQARAVLSLSAEDEDGIRPLVASPARLFRLAPFLDLAPYEAVDRDNARQALAAELPLDAARSWLLAAAPMRPGPALASWRLLGRALGMIADPPWQLLAVGDGEAREPVEAALAPLGAGRAVFAGALAEERLPAIHTACDLYVWPAYNEDVPVTLLEAQAAGVPVVAQDWGGAAQLVSNGETGLLTPRHDDVAFAGAVVELSANAEQRRAMGAQAARRVRERHGIEAAAATLNRALDVALSEC